jgi:phospho-N-acetylmuramoyl-pentapeptide-transferase
MGQTNILSLSLGLVIFSFLLSSVLIVPFIDLLYKLKLLRRKEAAEKGKASFFDTYHDKKAGTPVGGGILIIFLVTTLFLSLFPIASHMGISVHSSFLLRSELFLILFTFISFGFLGFYDDYVKIFGKTKIGQMGMWVGVSRKFKFIIQTILAVIIASALYSHLGIQILHIPLIDKTLNLGILYIPFAAFVIISFSNAYNITDGLDGLATGLLIICLLAFGSISATTLDTPLSLFIAIWIGALMAFAYFNVWPARIHLGDAGSLSFGAMLALIGLLTGGLVSLLVIGGIFVIEALSSLIQILGWKFLKKPIFPLAPIHHTFLTLGWEEPKIVMRAWLAGIVLAIFGLWLATI